MAIELIQLDRPAGPMQDFGERFSDSHAYFLREFGPGMSKKAILDVAKSEGLPDKDAGARIDDEPITGYAVLPVESADVNGGPTIKGAFITVYTGRGGSGGSGGVTTFVADTQAVPGRVGYPVFTYDDAVGRWSRETVDRWRPLTYRVYSGAIEGVAVTAQSASEELNRLAGGYKIIDSVRFVLAGFRVYRDPYVGDRYDVRFVTSGRTPEAIGAKGAPGPLGNEVTIPALQHLDEFKIIPASAGSDPVVSVLPAEALYEEIPDDALAWVEGLP